MKQIYGSLPRAPFGIVALGIVFLGLAGLLSRQGLAVSFAVFLCGCIGLPYAYLESKRATVIPFIVGGLLVMVGGISQVGVTRSWYALMVGFAGVASFAYGGAAELASGRRGAWDQPFHDHPHE